MTSPSTNARDKYVHYLRKQLIGPFGGESEWLPVNDPPHKRYITGILYPRVRDEDAPAPAELEEEIGSVVADEDEPDDSPLAAMLQRAPASAGLTFAVSSDAVVKVQVSAAVYLPDSPPPSNDPPNPKGPKGFLRQPLGEQVVRLSDADGRDTKHDLFRGRAELRVRWRELGDVRVVTISIVNRSEMSPNDRTEAGDCLYQVELGVSCEAGGFREPPAPKIAFDSEERVLQLRYRNHCAWASGHATSVTWDARPDGSPPDAISIDFTPEADIYPFTAEGRKGASFDDSVLSIEKLSQIKTDKELTALLTPFVEDHANWVKSQHGLEVRGTHKQALDEVLSGLDEQVERLRRGIEILCDESDPDRLAAFRLANQAMLDQMEQTAIRSDRTFDRAKARWRPFQLAFQLLAIPGALDPDDGDGRDLVDLIWFPTGGGKTEAYLLLAAFTIIYRRMHYGSAGEGTCVLSRYTLRLLTSQQFERTATLVCALERMRKRSEIPGTDAIDIGLWIGGGEHSSPNTCKAALHSYDKMLDETRPANRFMLVDCPWCGHPIVPDHQEEDPSRYGIRCTATTFSFRCPSRACEFHDHLPVQVVDECLYKSPPTILLATIDKFARLPWESRSRAFFGLGQKVRPPDLVIQDELHLISGPLGTIAAIYEAAIDVLMKSAGAPPKYIAATATIRGASDQARRLYGRRVRLFPASGPDADDSYYMTIDRSNARSRRYVGIMGQGHTPVTNTVHIMAAMADAGQHVTDEDDYWTLVAYHNSRRELGKTMTLARDDIPARIQLICTEDRRSRRRTCDAVQELSGNLKSYEVPKVLSALKQSRDSDSAVDILACTNMISVGVDVDRLNSMVILGQPKMSSEYIQASSRVGRGREVGGVVVVAFSPTKPRDRSHYENFVRFHESMYRWVEPTSVTPHSPAALDRALHASLITAVRLVALHKNDAAGKFDLQQAEHAELCQTLRSRLHKAIDDADRAGFDRQFDEAVAWWRSAALSGKSLRYKSERQFAGLMSFYGSSHSPPARATLNSMRNVDGDATAFVPGGGTDHE